MLSTILAPIRLCIATSPKYPLHNIISCSFAHVCSITQSKDDPRVVESLHSQSSHLLCLLFSHRAVLSFSLNFCLFHCLAANLVLLPLNFFASSSNEAYRSPLADNSLNILLILVHYRKSLGMDHFKDKIDYSSLDSLPKEESFFENPYRKALENARDIEC